MSIIDVLSEGFSTVTRKLWLAVVPMLLDLFLWLGPKLSIAPVIDRIIAVFRQSMTMLGPEGAADANVTQMMDTMVEALQTTIGRMNLMALLAWGRLGLPSIAGIRPIDATRDRVIEISSYGQMLLAQLLLLAAGLFIACLFLGMLGQEVRGEGFSLGKLIRRAPAYWLYMAAVFVPLGMAFALALSTGILLGPFAILIFVMLLWLLIYLSFVPQAITLAEAKPLGALWNSFNFVRLNFWPALGLLLLINVISTGLGLIWQRLLVGSSIGTLVAILANSYVGTGLATAAFIFYRERIVAWRKALEQYKEQGNG